jgi:hypothetical protein
MADHGTAVWGDDLARQHGNRGRGVGVSNGLGCTDACNTIADYEMFDRGHVFLNTFRATVRAMARENSYCPNFGRRRRDNQLPANNSIIFFPGFDVKAQVYAFGDRPSCYTL